MIVKNCALFIKCISEINNTKVDNAKDIDVVMPMYNLIEYSELMKCSSKNMIMPLTDEKKNKIKTILTECLCKYKMSLREFPRILGNIVGSFPAVTYGLLHHRHIERKKITGLK